MGWFNKLVGAPDAAKIVENTGTALDKLFTSKDEKMTHAEIMERIKQDPMRWQAETNAISAGHRSVFVAGARPFIVWVGGLGLCNAFLVNPWLQWWTGKPGPELPLEAMMELVLMLLGLATLRTVEKMRGVSK